MIILIFLITTLQIVPFATLQANNGPSISLREAASLGCTKCKLEFQTGQKTAKRHTAGCPRKRGRKTDDGLSNQHVVTGTTSSDKDSNQSRGPPASGCRKCTSELETGRKTHQTHDSTCPGAKARTRPKDDGDPPWRTDGNAWIGRRLLYHTLSGAVFGTRTNTRSPNADKDTECNTDGNPPTNESIIRGTITGFLSERDKDSRGKPAFVSEMDGRPAKLFHVEFDDDDEYILLNRDFDEWEILEQCEWIYDDEDEVGEGDGGCGLSEKANSSSDCGQEWDQEDGGISAAERGNRMLDDDNYKLSEEIIEKGNKGRNDVPSSRRRVTFHQDPETVHGNKDLPTKMRAANEMDLDEQRTIFVKERQVASSPIDLSHCSSFNEALKSALLTYASSVTFKAANNPLPPVPPPFLSHEEESTLRTALAFSIIKARTRLNDNSNHPKMLAERSSSRPRSACASLLRTCFADIGRGRSIGERPLHDQELGSRERLARRSFLSRPLTLPRRQPCISQLSNSTSNYLLMYDRELNHIREVLKLAVSCILPVYTRALEACEGMTNRQQEDTAEIDSTESCKDSSCGKSESSPTGRETPKRLPSAVYDFEAANLPPFPTGEPSGRSQLTDVERHYTTLDGLCQHAIAKLARLIIDCELKSEICGRLRKSRESEEGDGCSDGEKGNDDDEHVHGMKSVSDTIVELLYSDILEKAYISDPLFDAGHERITGMRRIVKIMASCHVLHRLLFLDRSCCFATYSVTATCRTLSELYQNKYCVPALGRCDRSTGGTSIIENRAQSFGIPKVQVVGSNWASCGSKSSYVVERHERLRRGIDVMFQVPGGTKRKQGLNPQRIDFNKTSSIPLPDAADVLAVNLLRLLGCIAAMRVNHRRGDITCDIRSENHDIFIAREESNAATKILADIRSATAFDLTMPVHIDDAAIMYHRESLAMRAAGILHKSNFLGPSAKLMMRCHFYDLIRKLSSYEQL